MKVDIGFWDSQGNYIPDIQEVSEVEMDKEIIIDGVDVAGCEFYQIEANELYPKAQYCGSMRNTFCEDEPNCYYKQLKRLEFELKITKADYEAGERQTLALLNMHLQVLLISFGKT